MPKKPLHVMFSPSAAGTLRQVLAEDRRTDRVVCLFDDLSFGPIVGDLTARTAWVEDELGMTGWEDVVPDQSLLEECRADNVLPIVWLSRRDTQIYAGFLWWLAQMAETPCAIIDLTEAMVEGTRGSAELVVSPACLVTPDMRRFVDTGVELSAADRVAYCAEWARLAAENAPLRVIDHDRKLVSAPITYFDTLLIGRASAEWQKTAHLVGHALRAFADDDLHQVGDLVLFGRLGTMAETGILEWQGDLDSFQGFQVRLPTKG